MPASFIDSPRMRRTYSPWSPPATGGTSTYSSMFSSARIGWPAATAPTSGRPVGRTSDRTLPTASSTVLATAVDALSSSSSARGLDGARRSRPSFSRLARCACTVEEEASPTALPVSRTVGGYPCLAEYRLMKSKISCWRLVRSTGVTFSHSRLGRTCVREGSGAFRRNQGERREPTPLAMLIPACHAPVAELVDAQG